MKRKKSSDYNIYNSRYSNNIISKSTKALTSAKEFRRTNSQWDKNKILKNINIEDVESRGFPILCTSSSFNNNKNTANLYLNKKYYIFKKKRKSKNKYFAKEQLFDRVLKLQSALNVLNRKYTKQKIENNKQSKEIQKQNKFLNLINTNNFKHKRSFSNPDINAYFINKDLKSKNDKNNFPNLKENIGIKEKYKLPENISEEKLKYLYNSLLNECDLNTKIMIYLEQENDILKKDYEKIKIANETLISNLKIKCKQLEKENQLKNNEIIELKKTAKCAKYNELIKENEIYLMEMNKIKTRFNELLKKDNYYKAKEEENKKLYDIISKKDFKIKILEVELKTLSNNLDETDQKFEDKIIIKDKIIKRQEREIKFKRNNNENKTHNNTNDNNYNHYSYYNNTENKKNKYITIKINSNSKNNNKNKNRKDIYDKNPELYQLYIEMKQKGINSEKIFINNALKKLDEKNSMPDNKIIFIESLLSLLNIEDMESKSLIMDIVDKEFSGNKTLFDIKSNEISVFEILFKNKILKNNDEIKQILTSGEDTMIKMQKFFEKYDKNKMGYITFNEMKEIIKEMKLENIREEILLYTKSEIFNKMNYFKLFLLVHDSKNNSSSNSSNINIEELIKQLDDKFKIFVDLVKKENNTVDNIFSYIKENITINENKNNEKEKIDYEVISIDNFVKCFSIKNIEFGQNDIELIKYVYGFKQNIVQPENKVFQNYIDYKKILNKLNEINHFEKRENE